MGSPKNYLPVNCAGDEAMGLIHKLCRHALIQEADLGRHWVTKQRLRLGAGHDNGVPPRFILNLRVREELPRG